MRITPATIEKACAARHNISSECYRLVDGESDAAPFVYIDRFGHVALAHLHDEAGFLSVKHALSESDWGRFGVTTVYLRTHFKDSNATAAREATLIAGDDTDRYVVTEHGIRYQVDPRLQVNAGLFLDMRDVRKTLAANETKSVLNLFCFTGSLGIAAYMGGALDVTQVDTSKAALTWARENFELNKRRSTAEMRFIPDDAAAFVSRQVKRAETRYDLIIIDPPSFGRSKRGTFSFVQDIGKLVSDCVRVLAPEGKLILTTNKRDTSPSDLLDIITQSSFASGRKIVNHDVLLPPSADFRASGHASIAMRGIAARIA